ncbi:hypothetical protein C9374_002790 [Naegleria lovaniensis]|uniref:Ras family small GTPase n=1 Tax=Naegleria lovaniensis TaxID=51637 RepID=A0AA88GV92_NAELO|nr:uncharacterized protein C9374_002790 [Naegleria lovaniensis]KAG2386344.1 hypothetical protein C9374_002790 [Naegleria lovaniensis]
MSQHSLTSLPLEILSEIFKYLLHSDTSRNLINYKNDVSELCKLDLLCKQFSKNENYRNYMDEKYWKSILLRLVGINPCQSNDDVNKEHTIEPSVLDQLSKRTFKQSFGLMNHYLHQTNDEHHKLDRSLVNILIYGEGGVGKTSIARRVVENRFLEFYEPNMYEEFEKQIILDDATSVRVTLWDTAEHMEFSAMRDMYIRKCSSYIIVCDITDLKTLQGVEICVEQIIRCNDDENFPFLFMINKVDLIQNHHSQSITKSMVEKILKQQWITDFEIVETSAKENINLDEPLKTLVRKHCNFLPTHVKRQRRWFLKQIAKKGVRALNHNSKSSCGLM